MTTTSTDRLARDGALRDRARSVIPGGMYGHQNAANLPAGFPQFMERARGCHVWDVDGNEYIDFLCSYGPVVLGHAHPRVEAAASEQQARADCQNGPSARIVELAELLVAVTPHADWAMFAKNGTDATTLSVTIARAATGRSKLLVAQGAYHGSAPWCTPRLHGVTPEERRNVITYRYNDLTSVEAAAEQAGDDIAAVLVSPFRHDARFDQDLVDPAFARGLRAFCDRRGAALILDDVRAGFRLAVGGSWAPLGVRPDLSAYSKAIANGYPLAAVVGNEAMREAAGRVYATGSFWFAAVPMAAAIATIEALQEERAIETMERVGRLLREGLAGQARSHGLKITQSGPVQMPFLTFAGDTAFERANVFTAEAARCGVYLHPWHNWFLSAAHTGDDIDQTLERTDHAFAAVRQQFCGE
ncbi:MAG: aminotransferase class III-fold pyridoxal phosphate-dependent enzyme [Dehalococcoidia bacterium]